MYLKDNEIYIYFKLIGILYLITLNYFVLQWPTGAYKFDHQTFYLFYFLFKFNNTQKDVYGKILDWIAIGPVA